MPHHSRFVADLADEAATLAVAGRLVQAMQPGLVVYLQGDLGAGKTTLVRGLLRALGYAGRVKSPTYTLLESYSVAGREWAHFDLYRMQDAEEWDAAGFRDEFDGTKILLIEWPDKAAGYLPPADWVVTLVRMDEGRQLQLVAQSELGEICGHALQS